MTKLAAAQGDPRLNRVPDPPCGVVAVEAVDGDNAGRGGDVDLGQTTGDDVNAAKCQPADLEVRACAPRRSISTFSNPERQCTGAQVQVFKAFTHIAYGNCRLGRWETLASAQDAPAQ